MVASQVAGLIASSQKVKIIDDAEKAADSVVGLAMVGIILFAFALLPTAMDRSKRIAELGTAENPIGTPPPTPVARLRSGRAVSGSAR